MVMPTSHECICCCEVERVVMKKEESADEISCIAKNYQAFSCYQTAVDFGAKCMTML